MRYFFTAISFFIVCKASAGIKDSTINFNLPDSVKAVQFMAEVTIQSYNTNKWFRLSLQTSGPSLSMIPEKKTGAFVFYPGGNLNNISRGSNTSFDIKEFGIYFRYKWELNETYKLLIAQATDSVSNLTIYSGYVYLPKEGKWKFLGNSTIHKWSPSLAKPAIRFFSSKKQKGNIIIGQVWVQRSNGTWKNLKDDNLPNPIVVVTNHVDSLTQSKIDIKSISESIQPERLPTIKSHEGIYYTILKEGTGKQIQVTDTVTVFYKGYLFNNGEVFDQTKDKPATFPLNRLIKGWQLGLPLSKVGGKIMLIIPSGLAYSIRTRAAKIPPNSILVFEIEVVDAK